MLWRIVSFVSVRARKRQQAHCCICRASGHPTLRAVPLLGWFPFSLPQGSLAAERRLTRDVLNEVAALAQQTIWRGVEIVRSRNPLNLCDGSEALASAVTIRASTAAGTCTICPQFGFEQPVPELICYDGINQFA